MPPMPPTPASPDVPRKIFVLDTSVVLYDFNALQSFKEHDVALPITVLEELDQFKKGNSVLNLQAREFIRELDKLSDKNLLNDWIPLDGPARGRFRVLSEESLGAEIEGTFTSRKADHRILGAVLALARREPDRRVARGLRQDTDLANDDRIELTYDPTGLPASRSVMGKFVAGAWQGDPATHPT